MTPSETEAVGKALSLAKSIRDEVDDCAVACRQVAELLDTIADANPNDEQLVDSLTGIGRLVRHTGERLLAISV